MARPALTSAMPLENLAGFLIHRDHFRPPLLAPTSTFE
jgi:hypothetical protein